MPASSLPPSGTLRLIRAAPNPNGASGAELFLFVGDATGTPVTHIAADDDATLPPPRTDLAQNPFQLRVLHINDLHGHLSTFTPQGDSPIFSKIAWRIRDVRRTRQDNPNAAVLALSAGDDLVGAVFDELLGDVPQDFQTHAGYRLYSAAGIDAATFGNHDLDLGTHQLALGVQHDANFPLLAANLVGSRWLAGSYYPAALFVLKGVRVGVIGLTTPTALKPQCDPGLHVINPVQVAHHILPAIRPLCDVVIILSHLGYSLGSGSATVTEAGDVELARSLPPNAVHLIVGGHTHHVLNEQGLSADNIENQVPIVQAGSLGHFLGEVDITIRRSAAVTHARLTPVQNLPADTEFEQAHVQPLVQMVRPLFERRLGPVAAHPDLHTDSVRNFFAAGESAFANFIADALVTRCRASGHNVDFAVVDTSCVRCGLPVGRQLTFGDWFGVMPFADTIRICWLTGSQLGQLLADNARRADRPGEPHTERGFLHFSRQLRYTIHLTDQRAAAFAADIQVNGIPLEEQLDRAFLMACTNFVRKPAAGWETSVRRRFELTDMRAMPRLETNLYVRDELLTFIRENGGVTEETGARRDGRLQIV